MRDTVDCHVYRSKTKQGMYLYLMEKDSFDAVPELLRNKLGTLEFSFSMTLDSTKKLVRLDTEQVMQQLKDQGYCLQMPPPNTNFLDLQLRQSDGF